MCDLCSACEMSVCFLRCVALCVLASQVRPLLYCTVPHLLYVSPVSACRNEFRRAGQYNFPPLGVPVVDAFRIFCQQVHALRLFVGVSAAATGTGSDNCSKHTHGRVKHSVSTSCEWRQHGLHCSTYSSTVSARTVLRLSALQCCLSVACRAVHLSICLRAFTGAPHALSCCVLLLWAALQQG